MAMTITPREQQNAARKRPRRGDRFLTALVTLVYAASVAVPVAWLDRHGVVFCPFRRVTDLPCPGCGLTHAFLSLGNGDLSGAFRYNALGPFLFALGLLWLAREAFDRRGAWPRLGPRRAGWASAAGLLIALAYGLFRILAAR